MTASSTKPSWLWRSCSSFGRRLVLLVSFIIKPTLGLTSSPAILAIPGSIITPSIPALTTLRRIILGLTCSQCSSKSVGPCSKPWSIAKINALPSLLKNRLSLLLIPTLWYASIYITVSDIFKEDLRFSPG
ncbi:protein of unknown function [Thermococcus nautili]|nr:protein of unknown function [Thermococcus nautili]